jgi:hypothetical protein
LAEAEVGYREKAVRAPESQIFWNPIQLNWQAGLKK